MSTENDVTLRTIDLDPEESDELTRAIERAKAEGAYLRIEVRRAGDESQGLYTSAQVSAALNRAADNILEAIDAEEEGKRDVVNLLVNAGLFYLDNPEGTLAEAIFANYQLDAEEVLDWCRA